MEVLEKDCEMCGNTFTEVSAAVMRQKRYCGVCTPAERGKVNNLNLEDC